MAHELVHVVQQRNDAGMLKGIIQRDDGEEELQITDQHRRWAGSYIHYWHDAARQAVGELPDRESDLSVLLVQAGTLLWVLSPLLAVTPAGVAIVGMIGAQTALLGSCAGIRRHPSDAIKTDIVNNLGLVETALQSMKENRRRFDPAVRANYDTYNNIRLAIWHSIFPNIGFQNRTQIKQNVKAAALQTIYERAGGPVTEMAEASRETTIAAIGKALIEFERWQLSWSGRRPNNRTIVRHFNSTFRQAKRSFDPTAGRTPPLFGFGYGAFEVLGTDYRGLLIVNSSYRPFWDEAVRIYRRTIRVS